MNKGLQNNQQSNNKQAIIQRSVTFSSGPLPPPETLKQFDNIVPGAADRIIKMAENQSVHRIELEKKVIESDINRSKWGQFLGFVIAISGLGVSAVIAIYGNAFTGGLIGVSTIASLVGVFMYGSKKRREERGSKDSQVIKR